VALRRRHRSIEFGAEEGDEQHPPILPLFVCGFLAAIVVRSSGVLSPATLATIATTEKLVLTVALVGLGMGVRVSRLRRLGGRPLVLGLLAWPLVAGVAFVGTMILT
jgi:uncharacterized membrane protein YadS